MPETWGLLDKSQVDNQKIDDAITQAIADHESDPEAHLGEGDSLQSHKASEIIDHIAGSIVADKIGDKELTFSSTFNIADGWEQVGSTFYRQFPKVNIEMGTDLHRAWKLYSEGLMTIAPFSMEKDLMFQTVLQLTDASYVDFSFGFCYRSSYTAFEGVGFQSIDGALVARMHDSHNDYTVEITGVNVSHLHCYRIFLDASTGDFFFFVDGVLKATIHPAYTAFGNDLLVGYYCYNTLVNTWSYIDLYNVIFSITL